MIERKSFKRIDTSEAEALLGRNDVLVLDVRDATAFAQGHIAGARNVSMANLAAVIAAASRTAPILIYCYHGQASQEYARILADFRFEDVCSLGGGYEGWSRERTTPGEIAVDAP
jgi:rhodanese-related sulfurtransferase